MKKLLHYFLSCALAYAAVFALAASPHHGVVTFGGLPLPGATITVTQGDKKLVAVSDQNGAYSFPDLADGIWKIQVEMLCFAPITQDLAVTADAPGPTWEMKLLSMDAIKASAVAGATKATGPVTAAAPAAPAAGTTAAAAAPPAPGQPAPSITAANNAAAAADNKKKAPAKGKSAAPAQPGGFQRTDLNASSDAGAAASSSAPATPGVGEVNAGGAADALSVGGSTSNGIESRAIGNNRKGPGSLYNFNIMTGLDSSYLDARTFSQTGQRLTKEPYEHSNGAASVGGPLRIPHLWHTNNGSFFLGYQWRRFNNDSVQQGLMPTAAERTGNFAGVTNQGLPVVVFDPSTGNPYPGNAIPQNQISPQATALLKYYPVPNFNPTATINYEIPEVSVANQDSVQTRLTKMINTKNFLNGSFNYQNNRGVNPNIFGFVDTTNSTGWNANATYRHMFNQRLNIVATAVASRYVAHQDPYFENKENVSGDAGITGNYQNPLYWGPPGLNFTSIQDLGDSTPYKIANQTIQGTTAIQWTHRPHNFQFGADIRRQEYNSLQENNPRGGFTFTGADTGQTVNGSTVPGTGFDFADFLLGTPDTASLAFGNADKYYRSNFDDAYANDDWHVMSGLTINGGVRWEYSSPISELYGRLVNLDVTKGWANAAPVLGSSPVGSLTGQKYPSSLIRPDRHGFEPKIGLAWRPFFGSSVIVHAGYALAYNTSIYQGLANQMSQQSPLSKSFVVANSPTSPLTLANGFNATPVGNANTFAIDPNFQVGYVQTWNTNIQSDLPGSLVASLTYLGNKGTRSQQAFYPNTYPVGAINPCPGCQSGYVYYASNGNSTRESGIFQIRRRLHNGITATAQYTYSKSIDDASLGGRGQGGGVIAQNWLDLAAERALSPFDQRHLATFSIQYTSGMGIHGGTLLSGWRGAAFKGWTVLTNINVGSGLPETPTDSALRVGVTAFTGLRPEYTGANVYAAPAGSGLLLNPAAYVVPASGVWGNAGRDSITGPGQFSLNTTMQRSFGKFDLTLASSNTLNHVVFGSWVTNIANTQFGQPGLGSANGMRSVNATLRWRF